MRLTVKAIGSGTLEDAYRVPLPTYVLVEHDVKKGTMIVEVPDTDVPPSVMKGGQIDITKWYAHIDKRYAEHAGEHRPELT